MPEQIITKGITLDPIYVYPERKPKELVSHWDLLKVYDPSTKIRDTLNLFYEGENKGAKRAEHTATNSLGQWMQADRPTVRGTWLKGLGYDPFSPDGMSKMVQVLRGGKVVEVERGDLTLKEAKETWLNKLKAKKKEGLFWDDGEWKKDTPQNRYNQLKGRQTYSWKDLGLGGKYQVIPEGIAVHAFPEAKMGKFIAGMKGAFTNIPLKLVKKALTQHYKQEAERAVVDKIGRWEDIERKLKKEAEASGLSMVSVESEKAAYRKQYRSLVTPMLALVPEKVNKTLARLHPKDISEDVKLEKSGVTTIAKKGTPLHKSLLQEGWRQWVDLASVSKTSPPDWLAPQLTRFGLGTAATDKEVAAHELMLRGHDLRKPLANALSWAQKSGLEGYFDTMAGVTREFPYRRVKAEARMLAWHHDYLKSVKALEDWQGLSPELKRHKVSPFGGQRLPGVGVSIPGFMPAHALGPDPKDFANWGKSLGFKGTKAQFAQHLRNKVIPNRINKFEAFLAKYPSPLVTEKEKDRVKLLLKGHRNALRLYKMRVQDLNNPKQSRVVKKAGPGTIRHGSIILSPPPGTKQYFSFTGDKPNPFKDDWYQVNPWTRNRYGMLAETEPNAFLYAALYGQFAKDGRPVITPFAGLTTDAPSAVVVGRDGKLQSTHLGPMSTWQSAIQAGAMGFKDMLVTRMAKQKQRGKDRAAGKGQNVLEDMYYGTGELLESVFTAIPRIGMAVGGFFGGGAESLGNSFGALVSGKSKESLPTLRKLVPSERADFKTMLERAAVSTPAQRNWYNKMYVQAMDTDNKIALGIKSHWDKKDVGVAAFFENVASNSEELVESIFHLPGMLFGPVVGRELMGQSPRFWDRVEAGMNDAYGNGYAMGSGIMNFFYQLRRGPRVIIEAPIDTLLILYPTLRSMKRTGMAFNKAISKEAMVHVDKLLVWAEKAQAVADGALKMGAGEKFLRQGRLIRQPIRGRFISLSEGIKKAPEKVLLGIIRAGGAARKAGRKAGDVIYPEWLAKNMGGLVEGWKQFKANTKTWMAEALAMREIQARQLVSRVWRGKPLGWEARAWAREITELAKEVKDPAALSDWLAAIREMAPGILENPALKQVFKRAEDIASALGKMDISDFIRRFDADGIDSWLVGPEAMGGLAKIIAEDIPALMASKPWLHGAADLSREFFTPKRRLESYGISHGPGTPWIFADWQARNIALQALRNPKDAGLGTIKSGLELDPKGRIVKMYADPGMVIKHLKRIRESILSGKSKAGDNSWFFGKQHDLAALSNKELGAARLYHGSIKQEGPITQAGLDGLIADLDTASFTPGTKGARIIKKRAEVVSKIDEAINRLKNMEELSPEARKALGLKPVTTKDGLTLDPEFHSLSTAKVDGTTVKQSMAHVQQQGAGAPGVFVTKGTSDAIIGARKPSAPVVDKSLAPDLGKGPSVIDLKGVGGRAAGRTGADINTLADINRLLEKGGHKPLSKSFAGASKAEVAATLARYVAAYDKVPLPIAHLIERNYGVSVKAFTKLQEALKDLSDGTKPGPALAKQLEAFRVTLAKHGPVAAFNEFLGRDSRASLQLISQLPTALKMLDIGGVTNVAKFVQQMKESLIGKLGEMPAATAGRVAGDVAQALRVYAESAEAPLIHKWWSSKPGITINNWTPEALKTPIGRSTAVQALVDGSRHIDIPSVFEVRASTMIESLIEAKSALLEEALGNGVTKRRFNNSFNNLVQRLRQFVVLPEKYNARMGVPKGQIVYVPKQVNSAFKWMDVVDIANQNPVLRWMKQNLTVRNVVSLVNNYVSSVMLQFGRTGHVVRPFTYRNLMTALRNERSLDKVKRGAAHTALKKIRTKWEKKYGKKEAAHRMDVRRLLFKVGNFLEAGATELELGASGRLASTSLAAAYDRIPGIRQVNRTTTEAYKFTDQGFKMDEGIRQYLQMENVWKRMNDGNTINLEVSRGLTMQFRKGSDGSIQVIGRDGKTKNTITASEFRDRMAQAASTGADMLFVNYSLNPKIVAVWKSRQMQNLGSFMPFVTWMYESFNIPGLKRGIAGQLFSPTANIVTDSVKGNLYLAKIQLAATTRAVIATQAGRDYVLSLEKGARKRLLSRLPQEFKATLIRELSDAGFAETKDLQWLNPFSTTDSVYRIISAGIWEFFEKGNLIGDQKERFENFWLRKKGDKKRGQITTRNLLTRQGERLGYSKAGKLTELGKKTVRLRQYIIKMMGRGETYGVHELVKLVGFTGGPMTQLVDAVQRLGKSGATFKKVLPNVLRGFTTLLAGGTVASFGDVAIGLIDKTSVFSSRSREEMSPAAEDALRFGIRRIAGLGFKIRDVVEGKKDYLKKLRTNLGSQIVSPLKGELKKMDDYDRVFAEQIRLNMKKSKVKTEQYRLIKKKVKRLDTILTEEVERVGYNASLALDIYEAAKAGKYARKGLRPTTVRRILVDGKWRIVEERYLPAVKKIFLSADQYVPKTSKRILKEIPVKRKRP